MANIVKTGFEPVKHRSGGAVTYRSRRVLSNNTTAIFTGDAVVGATTGDFLVASVTTTAVDSVAWGASYIDADSKRVQKKYLPAATLYTGTGVENDLASYITVVDNPLETIFEVQVANGPIALLDQFANYPMVLGAGSTVTGLSGHTLNATGRDATATLPWRVRQIIADRYGNDPTLTNCVVEAQINTAIIEPALVASLGLA